MSASNLARIETLNKENYDTWKMQMEASLTKNDAWGNVNGRITMPTGDTATENAVLTWNTRTRSNIFDAVDKLKEMDVQINNDLLAIMLLYSLPPCFENFRCVIESRDEFTAKRDVRKEKPASKNKKRGGKQQKPR